MMTREAPGVRSFLSDQGNSTKNTLLAAAISAMGVPFDQTRSFSKVQGDGITVGGRFTFYFEERSLCGQYETKELVKTWDDKEWHRKNPEHPWAYVKCAMQNLSRLMDKIKYETPIGLVRRGKKIALVSLDAPQDVQDLVFRRLDGRRP